MQSYHRQTTHLVCTIVAYGRRLDIIQRAKGTPHADFGLGRYVNNRVGSVNYCTKAVSYENYGYGQHCFTNFWPITRLRPCVHWLIYRCAGLDSARLYDALPGGAAGPLPPSGTQQAVVAPG